MGEPGLVRRYDAGMSVEALASSWARQEQAPDGAVLVLKNEVSGRLRGGEPWSLGGADGFMMAMVARPDLDPLQEALLWLPASLAAVDSLAAVTGVDQQLHWPDRVIGQNGERYGAVNVLVQLGPGKVEHAIFATRIDLRGIDEARQGIESEEFLSTYVTSARAHLTTLETDPTALLAHYAEGCSQMGQRVRVEMLPRGESRGRVAAIDNDGFLVLESPTGMIERIAPASLRSIDVVS